ncbi:MAG: glycosyltransferase [bacterium]
MLETKFVEDKILGLLPPMPFTIDEMVKRHLNERRRWKIKTLLNQDFMNSVLEYSPSVLFIIDSFSNLITADSLIEIRRKIKIPIVAWVADDPFPFYDSTKCLLHYDHIFACETSCIPQIKLFTDRLVTYLPNGVDPDIFKPVELSEKEKRMYDCDINFVGTVNANSTGVGLFRAKVLEYLTDHKVKIWGNFDWQKLLAVFPALAGSLQGGILPFGEANKAYNAARIIMNIHHPFLKTGTGPRVFEVAAAGGFQLADKKDVIEQHFELGKEMVCFESGEELKELVKYYLNRPEERREIAGRARQRVLREHTWEHRLAKILDNIK